MNTLFNINFSGKNEWLEGMIPHYIRISDNRECNK